MDEDGWLATSERDDVIESLVELALSLRRARQQPASWKWAIIAAHSALQGALVVALSGSAGIGALTEKSAGEVLDWVEKTRGGKPAKAPVERLADFMELVDRAQKGDGLSMGQFGGRPLTLTAGEVKDLGRLNGFRNRFVHFKPSAWRIELEGLPRIVGLADSLARLVCCSHPAWTSRLDGATAAALTRCFGEISRALVDLGGRPMPHPIPEDQRLGG